MGTYSDSWAFPNIVTSLKLLNSKPVDDLKPHEVLYTCKGLGGIADLADRIWVPLKGLYRGCIGIMEKKMETTI